MINALTLAPLFINDVFVYTASQTVYKEDPPAFFASV